MVCFFFVYVFFNFYYFLRKVDKIFCFVFLLLYLYFLNSYFWVDLRRRLLTFLFALYYKTNINFDFLTDFIRVLIELTTFLISKLKSFLGLGLQLMLSGVDVARSLNISVVMGLFTCCSLQKLAKKIGMKVFLSNL